MCTEELCAVRPGTCIKKVNKVDLEIPLTLNKVYHSLVPQCSFIKNKADLFITRFNDQKYISSNAMTKYAFSSNYIC